MSSASSSSSSSSTSPATDNNDNNAGVVRFRDDIIRDSKELKKLGYEYDYEFFRTVKNVSNYSCLLPRQIPKVTEILKVWWPSEIMHGNIIIDGNAHIGCDSIHLINYYRNFGVELDKFYCVELDPATFANCLVPNVNQFINTFHTEHKQSTNTKYNLMCGSIVKKIEKIGTNNTFLYLDPPWGGPDYLERSPNQKLNLFLDNINVAPFIRQLIDRGKVAQVILKVPVNFDFESFEHVVGKYNCHPVLKDFTSSKKGNIDYYLIRVRKGIIIPDVIG